MGDFHDDLHGPDCDCVEREWRCQDCGAHYPEGTPRKVCEKCGGPLRRLLVLVEDGDDPPPVAA
jgi:hypothetical protein